MYRGLPVTLTLAWLLLLAAGCAGPRASLVYAFQEIDCSSCLSAVAKQLSQRDGVVTAEVDKSAVVVRVTYDTTAISPEGLDEVVAAKGFSWSRELETGSWAPEIAFPEGTDVQTISHDGEAVDLTAHLAPGKVTVFDFYAPWCGPCRVMTRELKEIVASRSDVAVRKVNIADWDRPVVAQHLKGVANIPYLLLFGKDGQRLLALVGVKKQELRQAIAQAGGPTPAPADDSSPPTGTP